ncbi:hypothetical protein P3T35_007569 [Kitasatospora sp. GP30]|uniref:hypothetical protein n=1 Tax=Kitasatospora sp. GP30 TaxID=3035084 RepID=UPI000C711C44|nr:hypothetical protein [Kitasatospora sp. GP30]MDH6145514.1 hypothetical protein [Kitasatospora sp. GP30]
MNPHDPLVHPGAHLVYERLGVDDPFSLLGARYQHDTPRAQLAQLAGNAACDLDGIQRELADQTEALIARLQPMARGERPARPEVGTNLVYAAGQLDQLCARKDVAYERLTSVLDACDRIGGLEPHAPGHAQDRHLADAHPSSHSAPSSQHPLPGPATWNDEQGFALAAMRELERGDLWLRANMHGDPYVVWGSGLGAPIDPETIELLIAAGLVTSDANNSAPQMGRMLSLTPQGIAAHAAARSERDRQVAALYRGFTPTTNGPAQATPPAAAAHPFLSPRTR